MKLYNLIIYADDGFEHLGYFSEEGLDYVKDDIETVYRWLLSPKSSRWCYKSAETLAEELGMAYAKSICEFLELAIEELSECHSELFTSCEYYKDGVYELINPYKHDEVLEKLYEHVIHECPIDRINSTNLNKK